VSWDSRAFDGFRHGYAGTVYKSQGRTLDETYLLHSSHWRQESTYVALTRQRDSARVFVAREVAADLEELVRQVSRSDDRRAAVSYCTGAEAEMVRRAWEAAAAKGIEADAFARGVPGERVRRVRGVADAVGAYLDARGEAGALWAEIEGGGSARRAEEHPVYAAFQAAQERRHQAVRAVAGDPAALATLRAAGIADPAEVAADHLMATGTATRAEARGRAAAHAVGLGLAEPPQRQREHSHDYGPEM
jgi:hypothetical protein